MMRSLLVFALLLVALPASAGTKVLGVDPDWDMEETKRQFAQAGVAVATNLGLARTLTEIRAKGLMAGLADKYLSSVERFKKPPVPECLYFENGLRGREDVGVVAVCFAEKKYQLFIMPFFLKGKITIGKLDQYLFEVYGLPQEPNLWVDPPKDPKKQILLIDYSDMPQSDNHPNFIAAIFYVNDEQGMQFVSAAYKEAKEKNHRGL